MFAFDQSEDICYDVTSLLVFAIATVVVEGEGFCCGEGDYEADWDEPHADDEDCRDLFEGVVGLVEHAVEPHKVAQDDHDARDDGLWAGGLDERELGEERVV